jgi:hypothetical protein
MFICINFSFNFLGLDNVDFYNYFANELICYQPKAEINIVNGNDCVCYYRQWSLLCDCFKV